MIDAFKDLQLGNGVEWQMLGKRRLSVCWPAYLFMTKSSYSEGLP